MRAASACACQFHQDNHIVGKVAVGVAAETAGVGRENGRGNAAALNARGGEHRQSHGERAFAEAGNIVYGGAAQLSVHSITSCFEYTDFTAILKNLQESHILIRFH